jgi:hypothetical protein
MLVARCLLAIPMGNCIMPYHERAARSPREHEKRRVLPLGTLLAWAEGADTSSPEVSRTLAHGTVLLMLPPDEHGNPRFLVEGEGEMVWVSGAGELDMQTELLPD